MKHTVELPEGVPICRVAVQGRQSALLRLLLRREERVLAGCGIREAICPDGLPPAMQMGLRPVPVEQLRRALLPALLEKAFRQKRMAPETASVRLTAEGTSLAVYWAAQVLAERVRCLHLDTGDGQAQLADWLRQRYGLACGGRAPTLEVTLRRGADGSALLLGEDCPRQPVSYRLPPALAEKIPPGGEGEQLLSVLYRAGKLPLREISVARITFSA